MRPLREKGRVSMLDLEIPKPYRPVLRIGTCSWKYDDWKGLVYDPDKSYGSLDYLPDYARYFNTVEVDEWFWSLFPPGPKLPDTDTVKAYAESVPGDLVFSVKAPNAITLTHFYARQSKAYARHANKPNKNFLSLDLLKRFLDTLEPMGRKLGPVMFQFEYLNKKKMPSLQAFLDSLGAFFDAAPKGFCYAVETRNPNYLSRPFFDFLREHGLGYVFLEGYYMPHIREIFQTHDTRTPVVSVIRLHGHDRKGIEEQAGGKWDRIVTPQPQSLEAAAEIVRAYLKMGCPTYVNANNHLEGCAPLTAERFLAQLREKTT